MFSAHAAKRAHHARLQAEVGHEEGLSGAAAAQAGVCGAALDLGFEVDVVGHSDHGARLRLDGVPRHHRTLHRSVRACT